MYRTIGLAALALLGPSCSAPEDHPRPPPLQGMWSDVRGSVEDMFCDWGWCTDAGLEHLMALLDDPANDARPTYELFAAAARYQLDHYVVPRLTPAGRRQLSEQTTRWDELVRAINRILRPATE